jgi:hypothetical protein
VVIEQGLVVFQRLSGAKTLVFHSRKIILDMCKLVKNCVCEGEGERFRFVLRNIDSILSNLSYN